jgi:hypothetical protein
MARRAVLCVTWLALLVTSCASTPPADEHAHDGGAACIDRPGLERAPTGQLPCELLPPGFER